MNLIYIQIFIIHGRMYDYFFKQLVILNVIKCGGHDTIDSLGLTIITV